MRNNFDFSPELFKRVIDSWNKFCEDSTKAFSEMRFEINKLNKAAEHAFKDDQSDLVREITKIDNPELYCVEDYKNTIKMEKIIAESFQIPTDIVETKDIKVIDLINMFANNETLPKKILYNGKEWTNCSRTQKYLLYYSDITEQIFKLEMFNTPPGMTDQDMLNMTVRILEW